MVSRQSATTLRPARCWKQLSSKWTPSLQVNNFFIWIEWFSFIPTTGLSFVWSGTQQELRKLSTSDRSEAPESIQKALDELKSLVEVVGVDKKQICKWVNISFGMVSPKFLFNSIFWMNGWPFFRFWTIVWEENPISTNNLMNSKRLEFGFWKFWPEIGSNQFGNVGRTIRWIRNV